MIIELVRLAHTPALTIKVDGPIVTKQAGVGGAGRSVRVGVRPDFPIRGDERTRFVPVDRHREHATGESRPVPGDREVIGAHVRTSRLGGEAGGR